MEASQPSELTCTKHGIVFLGRSPADCPLCQREAAAAAGQEKSSPQGPAQTAAAPAEPAQAPPAAQNPGSSQPPHAKIAEILGMLATVAADAAEILAPGPWSVIVDLAAKGLKSAAGYIGSAGSANALTEAQAEDLERRTLATLNDFTNPLPTPDAIEAAS